MVLDWWTEIWQSPMATRYLPTDARALSIVAMLMDDLYKAEKPRQRLEIAAEIRQQTARFGLSNWDRNRMNWTISEQESKSSDKPAGGAQSHDPRKVLKLA